MLIIHDSKYLIINTSKEFPDDTFSLFDTKLSISSKKIILGDVNLACLNKFLIVFSVSPKNGEYNSAPFNV